MKKGLMLAFAALLIGASAHANQGYEVKVKGMTCASCAETVKAALEKIPNIDKASVKVVLKSKTASFTVAGDDKTINDQVKKAIEDAGYTVASMKSIDDTKPAAKKN